MTAPLRGPLVLVAGETSGDTLGAGLIGALRAREPSLTFAGIGGPRMAEAGMDCWYDAEELAVMGLSEVLAHLPRLLRIRRDVARRTLQAGAPVLIGIDAPDFNLGLERSVRRGGTRTIHYVSPSIWAWRPGRARRIGRGADEVLTLFPFEPELYHRHGVAARFVGHPLADRIPLEPDRAGARAALGLPGNATIVALLPGSRRSEAARLGAVLAETARRLSGRHPDLRFIAPAATMAVRREFEAALAAAAPGVTVELFDGRATEVLTAANLAVIASGTAALEGVLTKTPMIVIYRVAAATYFLVTALRLMQVDRFSLPNVLAGGPLVEELMQDDLSPESLTDAVEGLLADPSRRESMRARFREIHARLRRDADQEAAVAVLDRLGAAA